MGWIRKRHGLEMSSWGQHVQAQRKVQDTQIYERTKMDDGKGVDPVHPNIFDQSLIRLRILWLAGGQPRLTNGKAIWPRPLRMTMK